MTAENDLVKLYSDRILALATDIPHQARLDAPDASVKRRAPLCGSTVTVDVTMQDGKVTGYGQDVKACALGQAAAAVVGHAVIGTTADQIVAARDALKAMLKEDGPTPPAPFDGLEVLRPAKEYRNRHASILLTLEALSEAMEQIGETQGA
ncbi:MAG: iron-sulfur cluster assembly scaffold protein [Pseudomonadota bacterium]|jgi:NifU-like protein involved in Fe-S cluster formation|uniref:NifU homolog involved in Fe-S cluster formation n=1 Tax=Pseudooceanicola nitratireducens TaxID=517719 RepID=A0A1I1M1N3_9RHOB|nr:iron-sulfur cluster assembly scaffold protein [Pseudooceanicola nitratireducens]MBY6166159.1 iron-sulfur cluster assembly scaffold protein [Pseudooceanicola nitratireducens]MEC8667703.1 iron-sulfur cluster assembly scaffold protein [Pseudomonadota bacterium]SEI92871.1 NifU homolog involved in Fe-S cluster formation [Pseudooceanicola nitratireducens]SFC78662.1 NifU homolog involved in Fe-S cluster formation [Pseudooceanicola nitratireducens]